MNKLKALGYLNSEAADLNLDGKNEVLGLPNIEIHEPYETQAYAVMVLEGAHGDGSRSGVRKPGWETLPRGDRPIIVDGWYPPAGVPAAAVVNIWKSPAIRPRLLSSQSSRGGSNGT